MPLEAVMSDLLTLSPTAPNGIADILDAELVQKLRSAFDRLASNVEEWIERSLELGGLLLLARTKPPSDVAFGHWLVNKKLDDVLSPDDRAAIIEMARFPEMFRIVLKETNRRSY